MCETNVVTMSLDEYDDLREENANLKAQLDKLHEQYDENKVLTIKYYVEEKETFTSRFSSIKQEKVIDAVEENFEEKDTAVSDLINHYKKKIKKLEDKNDLLRQRMNNLVDEISNKDKEIERLKNRSLWQQIMNR